MTSRLALACSLLVACSSSPSPPPVQAPADAPAARIHRFQIGALAAVALDDGYIEVPNDGKVVGLGRPLAETTALLRAAGLPTDTVRFDLQVLLVKGADGRVLLFDTGAGDVEWAQGGKLPRALAAAGVAPAQVTDIFISHAHPDHVGGLVTAGALAFPAAAIHMSAPEWAAAQDKPEAKALVAAIAAKVVPFEPGAQLVPEVTALATPGHTPGHSAYRVGAGSDALVYIGDTAHHSIISVQRPAWTIQFDRDAPAAEAMRQQTLAQLAADGTRVFAVHFPWPGIGHVVANGDTFAWQPETR